MVVKQDIESRLRVRADRELAQRSLRVGPAYLFFLLVVVIPTRIDQDFPLLTWTVCGLFLLASVDRFWISKSFEQRYFLSPARWRTRLNVNLLSVGAIWGIGIALVHRHYGYAPEFILGLMPTLGITAGAVASLASVKRLQKIYTALLLGPATILLFASGDGVNMSVGILGVLYMAFSMGLGHLLNKQYWGHIRSEEMLMDRAEELEEAHRNLEEVSRAKSDFLASMSHEIRTPMNGVIGMTQLALEGDLAPRQREYLEDSLDSALSLLRIINDILDFSKVEARKMEIRPEPVAPERLLSTVLSSVRHEADRKGLKLDMELTGILPSVVEVDGTRLRQVLVNLLGNAIKFTPEGGVTLEVSARHQEDDTCRIDFVVQDSGPGIPPEDRERIFDAFEQVDGSMTRRVGGTGLGLPISKELVGLMGGELGLERSDERGSRFAFTLRLKAWDDGLEETPEATALAESYEGRVLLAEDNAVNRKLALRTLEKLGLDVDTAENGVVALEKATMRPYDMILMDLQMPEMDGLEATRRLRRIELARGGEHVPVIALTAHAVKGYRKQCLEAGMDDYLTKPMDRLALRACLTRWLSREGAPSV